MLAYDEGVDPERDLLVVGVAKMDVFVEGPVKTTTIGSVRSTLVITVIFNIASPGVDVGGMEVPITVPTPIFPGE